MLERTSFWLVDLVEHSAVVEVRLLDGAPVARNIGEAEEPDVGECAGMLGQDGGVVRPVEMLDADLLPLLGVEKMQIRLGHRSGAVLVDVLVDKAHRGLGQNAEL